MKLKGSVPPADQQLLAGIFSGVEVNFEIDTETKKLFFLRSGSQTLVSLNLEEGEMPEPVPADAPSPNAAPPEPVAPDDEAEDEELDDDEELEDEELDG